MDCVPSNIGTDERAHGQTDRRTDGQSLIMPEPAKMGWLVGTTIMYKKRLIAVVTLCFPISTVAGSKIDRAK